MHPVTRALWIALVAGFTIARGDVAMGLPQYAAQAGRACDTCHILPDWDTPKFSERKKNMSCQTCHVDPAGGGMRTTAGRYFGRSTLPIIATSPRPMDDWDRNLFGRHDKATPYDGYLPVGPRNLEEAEAYKDSLHDKWAWGTPKGATRHGPFAGRYGTLNPDPIFRVGADIRFATLVSNEVLMFPMQMDLAAALHPVHHVTALMNIGARGQSSGYSDTIDDSHSPYFRELLAMTNEWPYQSYAKAGRFVPSFGLRLDDHTNRIRREFELDGSLPESRVLGAEIGAVASYPFLQASYFKMKSKFEEPDPWDIFDVDEGWGTALNLGWRDLGWSAGASMLARRRPLDEGGDTDTYALYGSFNPWYYASKIPIILQGEIDIGSFQRASGLEGNKLVWYGEADWLARNGLNFLVAYDWADPDRDVIDDESGRVALGAQIVIYPGVTLDGRIRYLHVATPTGDGADLFMQVHFWW